MTAPHGSPRPAASALVCGPDVKANLAALMRAVQRLCGNLQVDISKARSLLGWLPQTSVDEGLRRAVAGWGLPRASDKVRLDVD